MSPGLAFGWHVWTRHRIGLTLCAGYASLLVILAHVLPDTPTAFTVIVLLLLGPGSAALAYLTIAFSFGPGARLEACESGYPSRLWTLPLRTRSLVVWPMLWGTTVLASGWLVMTLGVLRPRGLTDVPVLVWWPALLLAVLLAWVQALAWWPTPLSWLRLFLVVPIIGVALLPVVLMGLRVEPSICFALSAIQLPAAYLSAVAGVSLARRGAMPCWSWPVGRTWQRWMSATSVRPPFASPARAQRWFEWRRVGLSFPAMVFVFVLVWLLMMPFTDEFLKEAARVGVPLVPPELLEAPGGLGVTIAALMVFLPLMASVCGPEIGKLPRADRTRGVSSFVTTRPMSVVGLVRAKLEVAALSALIGWSVAAVELLLWLLLSGHAGEVSASFPSLRQRHAPGVFWGWLALLVGGAVGLTWVQLVQGFWLGLARPLRAAAVLAAGFVGFIGLTNLGQWLTMSPSGWGTARTLLPWLTTGAVVLKGGAATVSLQALRRRQIVCPQLLRLLVVAWLVLAAVLFAALRVLVPSEVVSSSVLVLILVLTLPLTRLALGPLTLDANRHR